VTCGITREPSPVFPVAAPCFRCDFALDALSLATLAKSLARASRRTAQHWSISFDFAVAHVLFKKFRSFRAVPACHRLVSSAFQLLLRMLFNFPSRYLFTFGQIEYLGLAHGRARFLPDFPCPAVLGMPLGCFEISHTWLSQSMACFFKHFCYSITIPH
jgi:hypothetical protein